MAWLNADAKRIIKSLKQKQLKFLFSLRCQAIENTGLQYKCHVYMTDKVEIVSMPFHSGNNTDVDGSQNVCISS